MQRMDGGLDEVGNVVNDHELHAGRQLRHADTRSAARHYRRRARCWRPTAARSATVTTSSPGTFPCRKKRRPGAQFGAPSSTWATSRTRTGVPPRVPMHDFAELSAEVTRPKVRKPKFLGTGDHAAARRLDVFALQRVAHIQHGEVVGGEFLRVEQNANLARLPAVQVHAAHAVDASGLRAAPACRRSRSARGG